MRVFLALGIPPGMRDELAWWGRAVARTQREALRPLPRDGLHVTLVFLGDRHPHEIDAIVEAAEQAVADGAFPDDAEIGGPLWLPPRRPRALALSVADPDGTLADLHHRTVENLDAAIGHEEERKRYRPHVTVARTRGSKNRPDTALPAPPAPGGPLRLTGVELLRSLGHSEYERIG